MGKALAFAVALLMGGLTCLAQAQLPLTGAGKGTPAVVVSYTGPGDVVSGAKAWWGLRAYSAAKAGTKAANICNSGDANCADVNTTASGDFDVTTAQAAPLSCGGAGGTCTIKTLYDQSGALDCTAAACDVAQATVANRPTLGFSCSAALPCALFSGSSQALASAAGVPNYVTPTLNYVAKRTATSSQQAVISTFASGGSASLGMQGGDTVWMFAGSGQTVVATDGLCHRVQGIFNGASSVLYVDGAGTSVNPNTAGNGDQYYIGALISPNTQNFTGELRETGLWNFNFTVSGGGQADLMNTNMSAYGGC